MGVDAPDTTFSSTDGIEQPGVSADSHERALTRGQAARAATQKRRDRRDVARPHAPPGAPVVIPARKRNISAATARISTPRGAGRGRRRYPAHSARVPAWARRRTGHSRGRDRKLAEGAECGSDRPWNPRCVRGAQELGVIDGAEGETSRAARRRGVIGAERDRRRQRARDERQPPARDSG